MTDVNPSLFECDRDCELRMRVVGAQSNRGSVFPFHSKDSGAGRDDRLRKTVRPSSASGTRYVILATDDEYALVQSGEMAARLGLLADARQAFREAVARRRSQGDDAGAAAMQVRLEALDLEERVVPPV